MALPARPRPRRHKRPRKRPSRSPRPSPASTQQRHTRAWERFNTVPSESATHGQRYVNNYANKIAAATYLQYESVTAMPIGSVLAKHSSKINISFKINKKGKAVAGPLFLMEKMPAGFNAETRDWKYWAVMPNGNLMGVTGGEKSDKVKFCAACHNGMGVKTDAMTFLPKEYRN
ncbi:MAG: cytochrome P460 family protein [Gammaproteobacteria bacterium]